MRAFGIAAMIGSLLLAQVAVAQHAAEDQGVYEQAGEEAEETGLDTEGPPEELGHGEHETSFKDIFDPRNFEFWGPVVNFLVVLLVITMFGGPAVKGYLVSRRKEIAAGLDEAQRLKSEAQAKYDEYASRLDKLDLEMERIRHEMVKAGEAERDRIVADAEEKAARLRRETEFVIEQQMKQLREDLTREAVQAAMDSAEKVLTEKISASDQERLAKRYLSIVGQEVRSSMRPPAGGEGPSSKEPS